MPYSGSFIAKFCFRLDISVDVIIAATAFARSLVRLSILFFPSTFLSCVCRYVFRKSESTTKAYLKRVSKPYSLDLLRCEHICAVCISMACVYCVRLVTPYQYTCNDTLLCKCLWKNRGKMTTLTISLTRMCVCVCACVRLIGLILMWQGGLGRQDRTRWTKTQTKTATETVTHGGGERSCVCGILLCVKTYRICVKVFMCWIQFMCSLLFVHLYHGSGLRKKKKRPSQF